MAEVSTILVRHEPGENAASIAARLIAEATNGGQGCVRLAALLEESASTKKRNVELHTGSLTVPITVSDGDTTAGDELLVGAATLEAVASSPGTDEYEITGTDAGTAASLAAALNAQALVKQVAVASAAGAIVSLTFFPGVLGDLVQVDKNVTTPAALTIGTVTGTTTRTVYTLRGPAR